MNGSLFGRVRGAFSREKCTGCGVNFRVIGSIFTDFSLEVGKVRKFAVGTIKDTIDLEFKLGSRKAAKKDKGTEGVTVDEALLCWHRRVH